MVCPSGEKCFAFLGNCALGIECPYVYQCQPTGNSYDLHTVVHIMFVLRLVILVLRATHTVSEISKFCFDICDLRIERCNSCIQLFNRPSGVCRLNILNSVIIRIDK